MEGCFYYFNVRIHDRKYLRNVLIKLPVFDTVGCILGAVVLVAGGGLSYGFVVN